MDKDAVSGLNVPDLAAFPLDDFFDHYEKGLRKVGTWTDCEMCCALIDTWITYCNVK